MDDIEYEDNQFNSTSHIIFRAIRFIAYVVVLILLGYVLWRIQIIDSNIAASDRFFNYSRKLESGNIFHHRLARSIKKSNPVEHNSFGLGEKELSRGTMLISKNETPQTTKKTHTHKENFDELVTGLFNKIWKMHNDTDRSHFDNNMKAVFQAWFPVFDALLPQEFIENESIRNTRSADKISSDFRADRKKREVDKRSKSVSKQHKNSIQIIRKINDDLLEMAKLRNHRSLDKSSEESSESRK
jgi:hypothetical protein